MTLSKAELKIIAELLEIAGEKFSNHGCNDFELVPTDMNLTILAQMHRSSEPSIDPEDLQAYLKPNSRTGTVFAQDHMLMSYFAKRCREAMDQE